MESERFEIVVMGFINFRECLNKESYIFKVKI